MLELEQKQAAEKARLAEEARKEAAKVAAARAEQEKILPGRSRKPISFGMSSKKKKGGLF